MSTDNKQSLPAITLAAIGVVYGDIGTSPLYTLRECLSGQFGFGVERDAVFGFLSLIFWLLIFVVSIKYLTFVMRADNAGEGGILTLMSLAGRNTSARTTSMLVIMGLIGGSFFYGEVVITPAISVMSAIEGLEIVAPQLDTWIVPLSIIVLTLLFMIQKHGTAEAAHEKRESVSNKIRKLKTFALQLRQLFYVCQFRLHLYVLKIFTSSRI